MNVYEYRGPVDCNVDFDRSIVKGKTAIVTGGAQGIGLEYVKALTNAGVLVVIGDIDSTRGVEVASRIANTKFIHCDVTQWEDQLKLFKTALALSPNGAIDYVIPDAGILGNDDILSSEDCEHPTRPYLKVVQINLISVMYTCKLALHYFQHQYAKDNSRDTCLILQGSLAGYLDVAGSPQYNASKFGLRGMMHSFRRTVHKHGTRVHYIAPWFVKTKILTDDDIREMMAAGVEFAEATDAADAMMKFLCDRSITGHSFAVVPRSWQPRGYVDIDDDDYIPSKHWLGAVVDKTRVPSQG